MKLDRILVATDGSPESLEAARYAAVLARGVKPKVTVVHVIPNPSVPQGTSSMRPEDEVIVEKILWDGAQGILDRTMQPFRDAGLRVEGLVTSGDPAEQLILLAGREDFDLIVVASRGEGGAERAILGSTSAAVVREAPCPVLVVRKGTVG